MNLEGLSKIDRNLVKQKQKTKNLRVFPIFRKVKKVITLFSNRRKPVIYFAKLEKKIDKFLGRKERKLIRILEKIGERHIRAVDYLLAQKFGLDEHEAEKLYTIYRLGKRKFRRQYRFIYRQAEPHLLRVRESLTAIYQVEKKVVSKWLAQFGNNLLYIARVAIWYKKELRKMLRQKNMAWISVKILAVAYGKFVDLLQRFSCWEPFEWKVEFRTEKVVYIWSGITFFIRQFFAVVKKLLREFEKIDFEIPVPHSYRLAAKKVTVSILSFAIAVSVIAPALYFPQSPLSQIQPAQAAVGHDTTSEFPSAATTGCTVSPCSYTHTPSGTPRGVLIFVYTLLQTADVVTGVTYGGVSVTAVSGGSATDTATEPGRVTAYFLGSSVPTGAQTVSVTKSSAAVSIYINTITITSSVPYNLETTGVVLQQENGAIAQSTVDDGSPGTNSMRFAGCYSGATSISAGASSTLLQSMAISTTAFAASVRETTAGQGARSTGCTAGNDDRAVVALAVREVSTTLGNGTDSSAAPTIGPDGAQTEIDRFSLLTTAGTDTVTGLTVTLSPANAFNNVAAVEVKTTGGVSKCSESSVSSNTVALTSCAIAVTTSSTQYVVYVTPKTHANMPAVPGASYATTATVTSITASNNTNGSDTGSDTVTIDNASPADVTSSTATAGDTQVDLAWTNPGDSDFDSVVVLRRATSAVADVPVEGTTYIVGNTIGTATVVCVTASTSCTDTSLNNGTAYHYKIFSKDSRGNYAAGAVPSGSPATPELNQLSTIATGTDPSSTTVAPESGIRDAGTFTLVTATGTDSVTALTVTLAGSGTPYDGVSEVSITNDAGSTTYFSAIASPSSNTLNFSGGTPIPVDTGADTFKIRVTPKTHANMAAVPGTNYAVSPYVSAFTSSFDQSGSDSNSNTLTIDNTSPANVTSATVSAGDTQNSLAWTNPGDSDFSQVVVLRRSSSAVADTPVEGATYSVGNTLGSSTVACVTGSTSCTDTGLTNSSAYHYKIFAKDSRGNYSQTGVVPTGSPATPFSNTTLGDGTDPSNSTIGPGDSATEIDRFTFVTGTGTDTVTALVVTLGPSNAYNNIETVDVQTTAGVSKCSASSLSSNTLNLSSCAIDVDTNSTAYKIMITPKSHANMSAVPGASYATTATVTDWTGTNTHAGTDTDSATITVDNASPTAATSTSGTAGDAAVTLNWTTSNSADFNTTSGSVVLRWTAGTAGAEVPVEGSSYTAGNTIGTATVACVTSSAASTAQSKTDGTGGSAGCATDALTNSQAYSYKIFQKDTRGNYDEGTAFTGSPFTPTLTPRTTIGNGTDPSNATVAPGTSVTDLDGFTFITNTGTDTITALTVTLTPANSFNNIAKVEITDSSNVDQCTDIDSPASLTLNFTGCNLAATTSSAAFKIRITPKTHANMPVPPGASYAVTGTVTAFTSTNVQAGTDSASATITIDNLSTGNPGASASPDDTLVDLDWTNPADADFASTIILKNTASITDAPVEGVSYSVNDTIGTSTIIYASTGTSYSDTGLSNGTTYYYKFFAVDTNGNYSTGAQVSATPSLTPTTIIGNGSDPSSSTVEPGTADIYLNAFTLRTNTGIDDVTTLVVTTANTSAIASMKIMSSDLATQYFATVSVPSGNDWSFSGGTVIPVAAITTFKVIITSKSHAALASGSYAVTGRVSAYTSTNPQGGSDSATTTITVDNLAAADVTSATVTEGDTQNSLSWTNPADADFHSVVVLRRAASAVADVPVEGTTYIVGNTIGTSTVACVTASTSCTDTGLTNNTAYHYKIFSKDSRVNYSGGVVPSGSPATPFDSISLGNGTDPANSTVAPESGITTLDAFTFTVSAGTDSVTALTVTLATNTYQSLSEIRITSDDDLTTYFSAVANPSANTVSFSGGTPIPVTTTTTTFKIRITPKSHADMPVVPGSSYAVTGTVTAFTSTNVQSGVDTSSATITIDNASPSDVSSSTVTAGDTQATLSWTNPADSDFSSIVVLRNTSAVSDVPVEGSTLAVDDVVGTSSVEYISNSTSFIDTDLTNGTAYHYKIIAKDSRGNYSAGVVPTGSPVTPAVAAAPSSGGGGLPPSGIYPPADEEPEPPSEVTPPTPIEPTAPEPPPTTPTRVITITPDRPIVEEPENPEPVVTPELPKIVIKTEPKDSGIIRFMRGIEKFVNEVTSDVSRIAYQISQRTEVTAKAIYNKVAIGIYQTSQSAVDSFALVYRGASNEAKNLLSLGKNSIFNIKSSSLSLMQLILGKVGTLITLSFDFVIESYNSTKKMLAMAGQGVSVAATKALSSVQSVFDRGLDRLARITRFDRQKKQPPDEQILDTVVFRSGELELIANQDQPIQSVVGFKFVAEVVPARKAESIGGTFRFSDPDGDGVWTAQISMPDVTGAFKLNTKIAYSDGGAKETISDVLIDPEGYVYELHPRGKLSIENATVTLWQMKDGSKWEVWPAQKYNQINPQITNDRGEYSFLAPAGRYYIEAVAKNYGAYRGQVFELTTAKPIHEAIRLQYIED